MAAPAGMAWSDVVWGVVGVLGGVIFYGRFYVQWIASEIKKRSVIPIAFWYMSSVGSLMLLGYGVYLQSPLGVLGQSFNIVVYVRNLVHIWREQGRLSKGKSVAIHAAMALVALVALSLVALTWFREYRINQAEVAATAARNWLWLAVGTVGQALFACRFLIQWLATEIKRKSVVPPIFWHISIVASLLQMACFFQRAEWVFGIGTVATMLIYARNLWFIHAHPDGDRSAAG